MGKVFATTVTVFAGWSAIFAMQQPEELDIPLPEPVRIESPISLQIESTPPEEIEEPEEEYEEIIPEEVIEVTPVRREVVNNCNPNYSGCVPNASDVDCAWWSGDWPAYVSWPIRVIGRDVYRLDKDGDWIGCE